jgi:hypothetical protein
MSDLLFHSDGMMISGPNFLGLKSDVAKKLGPIVIAGVEYKYDLSVFIDNVQAVGEDILAGRIPDPGDDREAWTDAIVREFQANLRAFEKGQ